MPRDKFSARGTTDAQRARMVHSAAMEGEPLVERLRWTADSNVPSMSLYREAADAIEALEKERRHLEDMFILAWPLGSERPRDASLPTQCRAFIDAEIDMPALTSLRAEVLFLLDRLREFENDNVTDETMRDWGGHVSPSMERLASLLSRATADEGNDG